MNENDRISEHVSFIKVGAKNKTILNVTICIFLNSKNNNIYIHYTIKNNNHNIQKST